MLKSPAKMTLGDIAQRSAKIDMSSVTKMGEGLGG